MRSPSAPLQATEVGKYGELTARPNPEGLVIVCIPPIEAKLQQVADKLGRPLNPEEIESVRRSARCIALEGDYARRITVRVERNWATDFPLTPDEWSAADQPLPTRKDFGVDEGFSDEDYALSDEHYAWRHFGGLNLDEADLQFRLCPMDYQEDFMFMGDRAFAYYFPIVERYLLETSSNNEDDDREAWILALCIKNHFPPRNNPKIQRIDESGHYVLSRSDVNSLRDVMHLAPRVLDLADFVLKNIHWFADSPDEQLRISSAWIELQAHLKKIIAAWPPQV